MMRSEQQAKVLWEYHDTPCQSRHSAAFLARLFGGQHGLGVDGSSEWAAGRMEAALHVHCPMYFTCTKQTKYTL